MTTPPQPGPYPGQSGASWPQAAPGQAAPPYAGQQPQPAYSYGWSSPAYGYPQAQARAQASAHDRGTGVMLLIGAVLAVAGSFPTLTKAVDTTSGGSASDTFDNIDKAWTFSTQSPDFNQSELQFLGLPLALGAAIAITIGILLLAGFGARRVPARALGLAGAGILFGATLTVAMVAVDDGQFDTSTRHTSFGPGFWLVVLSAVAALGAAIPGILARFGAGATTSASQGPATAGAYAAQAPAAQYQAAQYQGAQYQTGQYAQQAYPAQPPSQAAYAQPQAQPQAAQPQFEQPQAQQPQFEQAQVPQPQAPQPQAQPPQQPQYGGGSGWADPGQSGAQASPQDPQQPTG